MKISRILLVILAFVSLVPATSYADFPRRCRGGSLYKYDNEIKKAIKSKLDAASIQYKRVKVDYLRVDRDKDTYVNDFESDITIGSGSTPTVNFTGAFPDLTTCTLTFRLRITVVYPDDTKSITVTTMTAPGTMLAPLARASDPKDE